MNAVKHLRHSKTKPPAIGGLMSMKSKNVEVDLDYPAEMHDRDDDYPLAPETMTIEAVMTSEQQHELRAKYFGAASPFSRKQVCSLIAKRKYVVQG